MGLRGAVVLTVAAAACATPAAPATEAAKPPPAANDSAVAMGMLQVGSSLPLRPVVVALSDRLSIAATREAKPEDGAKLTMLAARLRERLWRFDRKSTDAREALELYSSVVSEARSTPLSCAADGRRALLGGELADDALETYREAYLAKVRQSGIAEHAGERKACIKGLSATLTQLAAFKPTGAGWDDLQRAARKEASFHAARASASASGSAAASARVPVVIDHPKGRDIVITPNPEMIGDRKSRLKSVQPYSWPAGGRVVLSLSRPAAYKVGVLEPDSKAERGHRIYIDLLNTSIKGVKRLIESKGLVEGVRLGKRKGGTRVVIDMSASAYHRVFYLPNPFRVMIDLGTRKLPSKTVAPSSNGKRTVRRVTLDPGHGGWDEGAAGPTGLKEKNVVLNVAHRAAPALASELGIETMLTRDTDVFVPLEERTARANAFHSDLFISIHCNATENGKAHGVEIFILDSSREMDAAAMRAVFRENMSAHRKHNRRPRAPATVDAQVASIAVGLNMGGTADRSRLFAQLLRKSTLASVRGRYGAMHDHGVKTAAFFVLLGAEMPAALFETSFISNPDDELKLGKADYRQKLADAIVNAVRAYRAGKN